MSHENNPNKDPNLDPTTEQYIKEAMEQLDSHIIPLCDPKGMTDEELDHLAEVQFKDSRDQAIYEALQESGLEGSSDIEMLMEIYLRLKHGRR